MGKGINLEEFRNQLDTDAQKRCLAQEKTIKELNSQVAQLKGLLKDRDKLIIQLQNRCFVYTHGLICSFCGCRNTCPKG